MKILHTVEFYEPSVGGMQEVVKRLSEGLVKLGHEVTVATTHLDARRDRTINGVRVEGFRVAGNSVRGFLFGDTERYRRFVRDSGFDVVVNFAAQQWATDLLLPFLKEIPGKKVFVPTGFSGLYSPEYRGYFEGMRRWIHDFDAVVFLSEDYRDHRFSAESGLDGRKFRLIPNGASEEEFDRNEMDIRAELGIAQDEFLVLTVGNHTGVKGHRESIRIFDQARIKNATLLILGQDVGGGCYETCMKKAALYRVLDSGAFLYGKAAALSAAASLRLYPRQRSARKRIMVRSLSREKTVAAFKQSDVFLFPSNIECSPIVLFEAMAGGTPFLASQAGNSLELARWSEGGDILPTFTRDSFFCGVDVPASARMLESYYSDADLRRARAEAGHRAWRERYTWEKLTLRYEELYRELLSAGPRTG